MTDGGTMTKNQNSRQKRETKSPLSEGSAGHIAEQEDTSTSRAPSGRERLGTILLAIGAAPSILLGTGLTLAGLCLVVLSIPAVAPTGLGTAFAAAFAVLMLPAGVLLLTLLILSRLRHRLLAVVGVMGNLAFGLLGIVLLFVSSPSGRAYWGGVVSVLCASLLVAGFSALVGLWLKRQLALGWLAGSSAFVLLALSVLLLGEWGAQTKRQVLTGHTDSVRALSWSPDGAMIASGSDDQTVRIWDAETGESLRTLQASTEGGWTIWCVAWSPDGRTLAACSGDEIFLWNAENGVLQHTLGGHTDMVISVAWSPSSDKLASASNDATVIIWDVETGEDLYVLETGGSGIGSEVTWFPYGTRIAYGVRGGYLIFWDAATGEELDRKRILSAGAESTAWSPEGTKLAVAVEGEISVFDAETWDRLYTGSGHEGTIHSIAWSPDGETLASGASDQAIFLWNARTGKRLRALRGHTDVVWDLAWSPDGIKLASASLDSTVVLWRMTGASLPAR